MTDEQERRPVVTVRPGDGQKGIDHDEAMLTGRHHTLLGKEQIERLAEAAAKGRKVNISFDDGERHESLQEGNKR